MIKSYALEIVKQMEGKIAEEINLEELLGRRESAAHGSEKEYACKEFCKKHKGYKFYMKQRPNSCPDHVVSSISNLDPAIYREPGNGLTRGQKLTKPQLIQAILNHPDWEGGDAEYLKSQPKEWLVELYDVSHTDDGRILRGWEFA